MINISLFPKVEMSCYWPREGTTKIANWIIEILSANIYSEYTLRELKLTNSEVIQLLNSMLLFAFMTSNQAVSH